MKRNALAPVALASILSLVGCDLSDSSKDSATPRSFAPRILDIPQSDFVRLEVSSVDLSNFQGNTKPQSGFYQTFQVPYSSGSISAANLPSSGTLYFRLSGLDASQTPIWVVSKPIPDGNAPTVSVGYNTEYAPRNMPAPTITTTSGFAYPMISCTSGSPAWTIDGSTPSNENSASTRFASGLPLQTTVQIGVGTTVTARCTDRIVWSAVNTYKFVGPTITPNPTGPEGYFASKVPLLNIPTTPSGQIVLSVNGSDTMEYSSSYSYWKIAYKIDQSNWNWTTPGTSIPYSSSGTISAYLMAWDGTAWRSGQAVYSSYPKMSFVAPGGPLPIPSFYVNQMAVGSGSSDISINASTGGYAYTNWKINYRLSSNPDTNWITTDLSTGGTASTSTYLSGIAGTGTITAYLLAYNSSSQNWLSGPTASEVYPAASAIGAGTSFPAPQVVLPSGNMGSVTYLFDTSAYTNYSHWNLVSKVNMDVWSVQKLTNASTYISGTGNLTAYLVAWNGSSWISGEAITKSYPPAPDSAKANGPGTDLSQVVIQAPESVPGIVRFSDPGNVTCPSCSQWKVAYKMSSKSADWIVSDLSTGITVSDTGNIDAYLMAWSTNNYKWIYGPKTTAKYPDLPTVPVVLPPGGSTMSLNIQLPISLPDKITFSNGAQLSYSHWMVTFKSSEMTDWKLMSIDSFYTMETNGSIYYYPMAWDPTTKRWITGTQLFTNVTGGHSITNPEVVVAGGPLPAPIIHGKSTLPADISFSLKLSSTDSVTYTAGSWKIVYQVYSNGISQTQWNLMDASQTAYIPNYSNTSVTAYTEAWNPTTKRWVSGKDTTIVLPIVVQVDAPVFKNGAGTVLGTSWEKEGISLPLSIEGPGTIYYTTNGYEPDSNSSYTNTARWVTGQKLTYTTEDAMTIKAYSVIEGGFKSSTTTIQISRPSWTNRDFEAAGCLSSNGSTVVACGDATGPWLWSHDQGWSALDPTWSYSAPTSVKVTRSQVLVLTNSGQVVRWNFGGGATGFEQIAASTVSIGGLDLFHDTVWATTPDGAYYYDETRKEWYPPTNVGTTTPIYSGTPGPIWADSSLNLWYVVGGTVYRYGLARGTSVSEGVTTWYNGGSSAGTLWIGRDPLVANGVAFGMSTYLYQLPSTPMGSLGSYMYASYGNAVQVVSAGGAAFVATDNGSGGGGVARQTSWTMGSNLTTLRKWPMSNNSPISSQGVVRYTANGSDFLLASSLIGTYQFRILP